jgi:hypothetical protein
VTGEQLRRSRWQQCDCFGCRQHSAATVCSVHFICCNEYLSEPLRPDRDLSRARGGRPNEPQIRSGNGPEGDRNMTNRHYLVSYVQHTGAAAPRRAWRPKTCGIPETSASAPISVIKHACVSCVFILALKCWDAAICVLPTHPHSTPEQHSDATGPQWRPLKPPACFTA